MATDVRVRGRAAAHSVVLRELLLLWEAARLVGGSTVTRKRLARLGGICPSTLDGWLSGRTTPRELDRLTAVAGELARAAGRPVRQAHYWSALMETDRAHRSANRAGARRTGPEPAPAPAADRRRTAAGPRTPGAANTAGRSTGGRTANRTVPPADRLAHRHRSAPPAAAALADAALDAVRLGHRPVLPETLLTAAAPHYLTQRQPGALAADRTAEALAYLHTEVPGAGAILTAEEIPDGGGTPGWRLADTLVRQARTERANHPVPTGLWQCLTRHAHPADRPALARSAAARGLTRTAIGLCTTAAEAGEHAALRTGAELLAAAGRTAEAVDWYDTAAEHGAPEALVEAAELLERAGQYAQAVERYDRLAEAGDTEALCRAAELLGRNGDPAAALHRFEQAARSGHPDARHRAGRLLAGLGRTGEALGWFEQAAAEGHTAAIGECARICAAAGRTDQAVAWWERAWEQGGADGVYEAARALEAAGRIDEAATWYERAAASGDEAAWHEAAAMLARHGQYGNLPWYADLGDHRALRERAERCEREGDRPGALDWYRKAADAGCEASLYQAADLLERHGETDRAVQWYELAAGRGDAYAMRELGRLLGELGRSRESAGWYRAAVDAGYRHPLPEAARVVEQLERPTAPTADGTPPHPAPGADPAADRLPAVPRPAEPSATSASVTPGTTSSVSTARQGPALLQEAVELLKECGRYFEADLLLRSTDRPEPEQLREAARMLSGSMATERAVAWVQRLADVGDRQAVREAAEMLEGAGRIDEALDWYDRAAGAGDRDALLAGARMLADRRRTEHALGWYRRAADAGDPMAHREALLFLQQCDASAQAADLQRYGWEPDARPAVPWQAAPPADPAPSPDPCADPCAEPRAEPAAPPALGRPGGGAPARRPRVPRQPGAPARARN